MSAPGEGISIREFARREGCNDKLVRRAIAAGHISTLPDGKISADLVGSGWRRVNRHADTSADTVSAHGNVRTPLSAAELSADVESALEPQAHGGALKRATRFAEQTDGDSTIDLGEFMTLADAERMKESALARLRQLEFDTKSGAVVAVADVARTVGDAYARVRTRLLALPAEQAPRIHRCKTPAEVQDVLMDVIVQALEELSAGDSAAGE